MAMNEKLDPEPATRLRDFLKRKHIDGKRVLIDIESETIEWDPMDQCDAMEILSLSKELPRIFGPNHPLRQRTGNASFAYSLKM